MHAIAVHTRRRALIVALAVLATAVAAFVAAGHADAAKTKCPNTFRVLHDDHVGKLSLRKGSYAISVIDQDKLTCGRAADLFAKFLQDYDGKLPDGWKVKVRKSGFQQSPQVGFFVKRVSGVGGGGGSSGRHPGAGEMICPGTFQVQHDDHIGRLRLPKGPYTITVIHKKRISCSKASNLFSRFLSLPEGNLPGKWKLDVQSATFKKKGAHKGFRVKQA